MTKEPGRTRPEGEEPSAGDGSRRRHRRSRPHGKEASPSAEPNSQAAAPAGAQGGQGNKNRRNNRQRNRPQQAQLAQEQPRHPKGQQRFGKGPKRPHPNQRRSGHYRPSHEELPLDESQRHAQTWWGDRWLSVLHRFGWKGRLANGRLYASEGRVQSFNLDVGRITAKVQGTRAEPYDVTITLKPLPDSDWDLVVDIMSCQALFTAQLLAGEMPPDVEEAFDAARAPLFPRNKEDIRSHCTCPDWANPCKHIAAVYYVMSEAFDKDPFLIFHLRGRTREQLLAMLRAQRAAEAMAMPMTVETHDAGSLETLRFWQAGEELESVHISIAPPAIEGGIAKRLGRPPFWRSPADPITRLSDVYEAIGKRARDAALTT